MSGEFYKGISDIPIVILAIFFSIFLRKFEEKKSWSQFFMLLGAGAFLGALVHMLALEGMYKQIVWFALYVLLYEVIRKLSILLCEYILKDQVQFPKLLRVLQIICFVSSIVLLLQGNRYDIFVFADFAVAILAWIIYIASKNVITIRLALFLGFGIVAAGMQLAKDLIPFGVVWGHLAIVAAICVLFSMAIE